MILHWRYFIFYSRKKLAETGLPLNKGFLNMSGLFFNYNLSTCIGREKMKEWKISEKMKDEILKILNIK